MRPIHAVAAVILASLGPIPAARSADPVEADREVETIHETPDPDLAEPRPMVRLLFLDVRTGDAASADEVAAAQAALEGALRALEHIEVVGPGGLDREAVPDRVREEMDRASNFARKGRENLLNLSIEDAVDAYQTARVLLRKQMQWLDDPDRMIVVLMGLAEALATAGNPEGAEEAYHEVLVLSPGYEPDPGQVPSKFRSLFDDVRERAAQELPGSVRVSSEPGEATVALDGLSMGATPAGKDNVPAGLHSLVVGKPGFKPMRKVIEVAEGETTTIHADLQASPAQELVRKLRRELTTESFGESPEELARELSRRAGVQAVVVSQIARTRGQLVLSVAMIPGKGDRTLVLATRLEPGKEGEVCRTLAWQISDALDKGVPDRPPPAHLGLDFGRHLLGTPRPEVTAPGPVATKLIPPPPAVVLPPGALNPGEQPIPPEDDVPIWGTWWFWAGTGALVVGAVATTLALTLDRETETVHDPDLVHIQIQRVTP